MNVDAPVNPQRLVYLALNDASALGGIQTAARALASMLSEAGYDVVFVVVRGDVPGWETISPFRSAFLSRLRAFVGGGMRAERLDFVAQCNYRRELKRLLATRPGALVALDVFSAQIIPASALRGVPSAFQFHNSFDAVSGTRELRRIARVARKFAHRFALTSADARYFSRATRRIFVEQPNPLRFERRREPNLTEQTVISIGRLERSKRVDLTVRAWASLPEDRRAAWTLLIVGDGQERTALEQLARQLGVEESVEFAGRRDDVLVLLRTSSIYVLTSEFEGLPMGVTEALSQGLACIATASSPGVRELLGEGAGRLVDVGDVAGVTRALDELINDPRALREQASKGLMRSAAFSADRVLEGWRKVIDG